MQNADDREELQTLLREQRALAGQMAALSARVEALAARVAAAEPGGSRPHVAPPVGTAPAVSPTPAVTPVAGPPPVPVHLADAMHSARPGGVVPASSALSVPLAHPPHMAHGKLSGHIPVSAEQGLPLKDKEAQAPPREVPGGHPNPATRPLATTSSTFSGTAEKVAPAPGSQGRSATAESAALPPAGIRPAAAAPPPLRPASASLPVTPSPATAPEGPSATGVQRPALALEQGWEEKFGAYWLPRIGALLFIIALGSLGTYLYYNYIEYIGPDLKFAALLAISAGLAGFGAWIERRKDFADYGGVVLAAGLAGVYFTLYAGYHVEQVRVIPSLTADVLLLMAWAGVIIALAQWRASEGLAMMAVLLGFLPLTMSPVNAASLSANFILAVAAVGLMLRNRWTWLSYASIVCTYAAFFFWRLPWMDVWRLEQSAELGQAPFEVEAGFLLAYWLVYTAVVFLSTSAAFTPWGRVAYATLNNAAIVVLFALRFSGDIEQLCLIIIVMGAVLAAVYLPARYVFRLPEVVGNAYLAHALILLTAGVSGYYSGLVRASILLAGSTMLLVRGTQAANMVARVFARLIAAVAFCAVFYHVAASDPGATTLGLIAIALWLYGAWWSRNVPHGDPYVSAAASSFEEAPPPPPAAAAEEAEGSPAGPCSAPQGVSTMAWMHSFFYCCLAVLVAWAMTVAALKPAFSGYVMAAVALLCVLAAPGVRIRELAVSAQGLLFFAQVSAMLSYTWLKADAAAELGVQREWWQVSPNVERFITGQSLFVIAVTLAVSAWWAWANRTRILGFWFTASGRAAAAGVRAGVGGEAALPPEQAEGAAEMSAEAKAGTAGAGGGIFGYLSPAGLYIAPFPLLIQIACAIGLWGMVEAMLGNHPLHPHHVMALLALIAVVLFAFGIGTGDYVVAGFSQYFLLRSLYYALLPASGWGDPYPLHFAITPFIAIAATVSLLEWRCRTLGLAEAGGASRAYTALSGLMWMYIVGGLVLWALFIPVYAAETMLLLSYALTALAITVAALVSSGGSRPWLAVPVAAVGLLVWMAHEGGAATDYAALGVLALVDALARVRDPHYATAQRPWFVGLMIAIQVGLVIAIGNTASALSLESRVTLMWAGASIAVFALGLALRERVYRLGGLAILLLAMARVGVYDIWQFATIFKILTIFALAAVCLAVSMAYVWWGKKMRDWL
ncbi:hypothetical protein DB346_15135 [Verrucomicrobia bacterium LW23]|nr:hypothetical protein DB346_15135 [Verrucomicrobia bacterium LW23]